ncbi:hypothetical protein [Alicyclobacillus mengziensis]|uniref:Uncharacterized protein n=1 Tax=Alicyclobacillus mengziensis TaxID=2931921 RepID=A0A9X7VW53_9BACL|nr:hypothetical protein [Alicyclobacillus mengziensis]QSO46183.1 hypothetical protein JZ786_16935 [Alicyclobacillus mengziensis]
MSNHPYFRHNDRLCIPLPVFPQPFEEMAPTDQENIIAAWESIRARIPDRILELEQKIQGHLESISQTDDWEQIIASFNQISDIASRIAELNTWQRVDPHVTTLMDED